MTTDTEHTALVIPADPAAPAHTVTWTRDDDVLDLLCTHIGCSFVDLVTLAVDGAPDDTISLWCDDDGIPNKLRPNPRLTHLARGLGQPLHLFGTVVITGNADTDGNTLGLDPELLDQLHAAVTP